MLGAIQGELTLSDLDISLETLDAATQYRKSRPEKNTRKKTERTDANSRQICGAASASDATETQAPASPTLTMPDNWMCSMSEETRERLQNLPPRETITFLDNYPEQSPSKTTIETVPKLSDGRGSAKQPKPVSVISPTLVGEPPRRNLTQTYSATQSSMADERLTLTAEQPMSTLASQGSEALYDDLHSGRFTVVSPLVERAPASASKSFIPEASQERAWNEKLSNALKGDTPKPPGQAEEAPAVEVSELSEASGSLDETITLFLQYIGNPLDPKYRWSAGLDIKEKLSSHLRVLSQRKEESLMMLIEALATTEPGRLAGAAYVFIAVYEELAIPQIMARLMSMESSLVASMATAMKYAPSPRITESVLSLFTHERPAVRTAAATIAAYRGDVTREQIMMLFGEGGDLNLAAILSDELHKLPPDRCSEIWQEMLGTEDEMIQRSAVLAMLKAHQQRGIDYLNGSVREGRANAPWMLDYWALCGGPDAYESLDRYVNIDALSVSAVRAMGRLGNPGAVDVLLRALESDREDTRAAAVEALNQITGAEIAEEPEGEAYWDAHGKVVTGDLDHNRERPPAPITTSRRLWERWWRTHRDIFQKECFYRRGAPFEFRHCIEEIARENTPNANRLLAYQELVIRAGVDVPLRVDWPAEKQQDAVHALWEWWHEHGEELPKGGWYFGKARMPLYQEG
jgi:HEAT repeat protein